jgi:hypothetical protein
MPSGGCRSMCKCSELVESGAGTLIGVIPGDERERGRERGESAGRGKLGMVRAKNRWRLARCVLLSTGRAQVVGPCLLAWSGCAVGEYFYYI